MCRKTLGCPAPNDCGTVEADLQCVCCGYNLRGLATSGSCPECGSPVATSTVGLALEHADPEWLGRVDLGLRMLCSAPLLLLILVGVVTVAALCGFRPPAKWWTSAKALSSGWGVVALWSFWPLWLLYYGAAIFATSSQEPRMRVQEGIVSVRRVIRVALALLATNSAVRIGALGFSGGGFVVDSGTTYLVEGIGVFSTLVLAGVYLSGFAARGHRPWLEQRTRWILIGLVCACSLTMATQYIDGSLPAGPVFARVVEITMLLAGVAALVYSVRYLLVLRIYERLFREAIASGHERVVSK